MTEKRNKGGRPPKHTALVNPALKALRAEAVIKARARGATMKELAEQYRCSENTLYTLIKWAKNEGLLRELRDRVVEEIAPLSINAYKDALSASVNDLTPNQVKAHKMKISAAKDVNAGIGIFQKHSQSQSVKEEFTLQAYYEKRNQRIETSEESEVTDAQLLPPADVDPQVDSEGDGSEDDFGGFSESSDSGDGGESGDGDVEA